MDINTHLNEHEQRTWQRMLSGRRLNLLNPSPLDIEIEDIALGLSRNVRWNGQTIGDYGWNIAQHSDLVVTVLRTLKPKASAELLMYAKLHDASEYVTHDLITPFKNVVGDVYKEVESRLQSAVYLAFELQPVIPEAHKKLIKKADLISAATEAQQLAGFSASEVKSVLGIKEKAVDIALEPLPPKKAEKQFLKGFYELKKSLALQKRSHM